MKAKKKYKGGGKIDAALRAELKKKTTKAKPAVKIKNTPMERIADTGLKGKVYQEMSDELVNKAGAGRMQANQLAMATINATYPAKVKSIGKEAGAKTYGQLADAVERYKFGGKIYKDGGLALFKALKKKFGEG